MEDILKEVIETVGGGMPEVRMADEDYGQLEMIDNPNVDTYPLVYPAVLVEMQGVEWSELAPPAQVGTATVRVRLVVDCYDDTHHTSGTLEAVEGRRAMLHRLYSLLHGREMRTGGKMERKSSRFYTANHGIKVYEDVYTVRVTDSPLPPKQPAPALAIRIVPSE